MLEGYIFTIEGDNFLMWSDSQQKLIEVPRSLLLLRCEKLHAILSLYGIEPIHVGKEATAEQNVEYPAEHQCQEK